MSRSVSNSELSGEYAQGHEPATLASHGARTAGNSAGYLLPVLTPGMTLLDIGCGPGSVTLDLAQQVAPGRVVGIENVEEPLIAAREAASARGDTRTRFRRGDAHALPFEDDTFDVVHAHQVLQHLSDPVRALGEMARVCKPGGWVAAREADYAAMTWHPEVPELEEWRAAYRAVARGNGAEPDAARRLRAWANAAGLTRVRFTATVWNYAEPEICRWWGQGQAERYSGPTFVGHAAVHGIAEADLQRMARAWRSWGEDPEAWFAILHGEMLVQLDRDPSETSRAVPKKPVR